MAARLTVECTGDDRVTKTLEEKRAAQRAASNKHRLANKEAVAAANKEWRTKNRERKRVNDAAYKAANAEKMKAQSLAYSKQHRDKIRAYRSKHHASKRADPAYTAKMLEVAATWRSTNPDKMALQHADRAFKFQRATPEWADLEAIKVVYEKRDEYSVKFGVPFQVDHVIPINSRKVCGLHVPANLQLLEKKLNGAKGNRFETDW